MTALPVVVSYGGYNAAGRSSFDQSYRRMVIDSLGAGERDQTLAGLAALMGISSSGDALARGVMEGTLVRRIEAGVFDPDAAPWNARLDISANGDGEIRFEVKRRQLPEQIPADWQLTDLAEGRVQVSCRGNHTMLMPGTKPFPVKAAGQLPSGFNPGDHYPSRSQPRGLQMAIAGASDALHSLGIDWDLVCAKVRPDEIGMYAASALGQLQDEGWGGVLKARWLGGRPTAKQVPLALNSMPADFVNAYVLGNVGHTEAIAGACAGFLYNLQAAIRDIQLGHRKVAIVGGSEAPITLENLEGFMAMSALATEEGMARLDGTPNPDPRRYSRPFCDNAGFVMGESSQYVILMDDSLAVELGADIHGAMAGVFMDADGVKKSISSPGPGNYITFAKALGLGRAILGDDDLRRHTLIMAHGSSTPQNRVTESLIFDRLAKAFDIHQWPVCAVKAYLGHSMATASGDQVVAAIAAMRRGLVPGIKTGTAVAADVHQERLAIPIRDLELGPNTLQATFINAKGFGGNNATGLLLSPARTEAMLASRHSHRWSDYQRRREAVRQQARDYEARADQGQLGVIYRFGEGMVEDDQLSISSSEVAVPGFGKAIPLDVDNPYGDMG